MEWHPTDTAAHICPAVEHISFKLDGEAIPDEKIVFGINGKQFMLHQLPELYAEYWFTLDYATITVYKAGGLSAGEHILEYRIRTRIPFSGYFGEYESADNTVSRSFVIEEGK